MSKNQYACSLFAYNPRQKPAWSKPPKDKHVILPIIVDHAAVVIEASDAAQAIEKAQSLCYSTYPVDDGWKNHNAKVVPIATTASATTT